MRHEGGCHCGSVVVWFDTDTPVDQVQVRACTCDFCRRHGARYVSDPDGWLEVRSAPGALSRYRFATGTADFLFCEECGVYIAAVSSGGDTGYGVLNLVGAGIDAFDAQPVASVDLSAEAAGDRASRRAANWTPAAVVEAMPNA